MWSAAILAGGRARRFGGHDKGALLVGGRSIRERQIAELASVTSDILIVGGAEANLPAAARHVADLQPDCGPLGGLLTALTEALGEAMILVAGDMPYITARLAAHLLALTRDADVVVPRTERGYHPLCAAYTHACAEPAARRLRARQLKMTDLFADVRVRVVTAEELDQFGDHDHLLANVNTPADYLEIEARRGHQP